METKRLSSRNYFNSANLENSFDSVELDDPSLSLS